MIVLFVDLSVIGNLNSRARIPGLCPLPPPLVSATSLPYATFLHSS